MTARNRNSETTPHLRAGQYRDRDIYGQCHCGRTFTAEMNGGKLSFRSMAEVVSVTEMKRLRWSDAEHRGDYRQAQALLREYRAAREKPEQFIHSLCAGDIMFFDHHNPVGHRR
jgi:hypothetical protein